MGPTRVDVEFRVARRPVDAVVGRERVSRERLARVDEGALGDGGAVDELEGVYGEDDGDGGDDHDDEWG